MNSQTEPMRTFLSLMEKILIIEDFGMQINCNSNGLFGLRGSRVARVELAQNYPIFSQLYSTLLHSPSILLQSKLALSEQVPYLNSKWDLKPSISSKRSTSWLCKLSKQVEISMSRKFLNNKQIKNLLVYINLDQWKRILGSNMNNNWELESN